MMPESAVIGIVIEQTNIVKTRQTVTNANEMHMCSAVDKQAQNRNVQV